MSFFIKLLFLRDGIYIHPTKLGNYFNGLIFLLILLSVGYGNNLLLILSLFLFSLNFIWIFKTYFHLKKIKLLNLNIGECFSLQNAHFRLTWKGKDLFLDSQLYLKTNKGIISLRVLQNDENDFQGEIYFNKRGMYVWDKILYSSTYPFGLYQIYKVDSIQGQTFVAPSLISHFSLSNSMEKKSLGQENKLIKGNEEFSHFQNYQGESLKKIDWKIYSKNNLLVIKERESSGGLYFKRTWPDDFKDFEKEHSLSMVMSELKFHYERGNHFELIINNKKFSLESNPSVYIKCKQELSTC